VYAYDGYSLEEDGLSERRDKEFLWANPRLFALFPQKRGRFEYWF
jgi:hypothetical protein